MSKKKSCLVKEKKKRKTKQLSHPRKKKKKKKKKQFPRKKKCNVPSTKKRGGNTIFVPKFSPYSHFGSYILIFLIFVWLGVEK